MAAAARAGIEDAAVEVLATKANASSAASACSASTASEPQRGSGLATCGSEASPSEVASSHDGEAANPTATFAGRGTRWCDLSDGLLDCLDDSDGEDGARGPYGDESQLSPTSKGKSRRRRKRVRAEKALAEKASVGGGESTSQAQAATFASPAATSGMPTEQRRVRTAVTLDDIGLNLGLAPAGSPANAKVQAQAQSGWAASAVQQQQAPQLPQQAVPQPLWPTMATSPCASPCRPSTGGQLSIESTLPCNSPTANRGSFGDASARSPMHYAASPYGGYHAHGYAAYDFGMPSPTNRLLSTPASPCHHMQVSDPQMLMAGQSYFFPGSPMASPGDAVQSMMFHASSPAEDLEMRLKAAVPEMYED
eukprot:TRINITY_DN19689_c0_g3_i1.p1 TRINITY_DN19689_c0_g3~~TRINITY_DN19689_c0_g3_i1.p1  ORF type:complete len:366 (-),score=68.32 TRINITY_DN19689_c0_g3_i1:67-1164(-)